MPSKRRGNLDASIRERREGLWEARILLDGKRKSVYADTRVKVLAKVRALVTAHEKGLHSPGGRLTVAQYLDDWLVFVKARVRPRTYARYEQYVRIHLKSGLGHLQLVKLTAERLERFYAETQAAGLSARSVHHLHVVLGTALRRALRLGLVAQVASDIAEPPRVETAERPTLPATQIRALLDAAAGHRFEALIWLAVHTGMREGELLGLRWQYVDLDAGTVQVAATLQATKDGFTFAEPKTDRSSRTITVGREVIARLRAHRARQGAERIKLGKVWTDLDLVFPNEVGSPMAASNFLRRVYWPLLDKVGLCYRTVTTEQRIRRGKEITVQHVTLTPMVRFHDLRHAFASLALEQNIHPSIVAATLGHARTSTTVDMYTHAQPGMTAQATTAVEDLIAGTPQPRSRRGTR